MENRQNTNKAIIRLTESELFNIISNSVKNVLKEEMMPSASLSQLIQQAQSAFEQAKEMQQDETPLMSRNGESYGLTGPIRIDKRGWIVIPMKPLAYYDSEHTLFKAKVLTKRNGRVVEFPGDMMTDGSKDARRILKNIIKDAERGNKYFHGYDPNWEDGEDKEGKNKIRQFNRSLGLPKDMNL